MLRRRAPKNEHIICLDKRLPCHIVAEMIVTRDVLSHFNLKSSRSRFLLSIFK